MTVALYGRARAVYVYRQCRRVYMPCTRPVYTGRVHDSVRALYTAVFGRVHGAYTAVYMAGYTTCTRPLHGRVLAVYTAVYGPCTHGRVHGRRFRPSTWRIHGRVRVLSASVHGRVPACTQRAVYMYVARTRPRNGRVHGRVGLPAMYTTGRVPGRLHGSCTRTCMYWPCTRLCKRRVHGCVTAVYTHVYGRVTAVLHGGREWALYTAAYGRFGPCTRPCTCRVHDRPCTRSVTRPVCMARVHDSVRPV